MNGCSSWRLSRVTWPYLTSSCNFDTFVPYNLPEISHGGLSVRIGSIIIHLQQKKVFSIQYKEFIAPHALINISGIHWNHIKQWNSQTFGRHCINSTTLFHVYRLYQSHLYTATRPVFTQRATWAMSSAALVLSAGAPRFQDFPNGINAFCKMRMALPSQRLYPRLIYL